ncbi:MAG: glycerol kinase [Planctomycetota bacterium]|jgi:glycerol kinase
MNVLAIDQGTTSTRALRVDSRGQVEITCVLKHQQYYPNPGWVEQDPEELITNIKACIEASPGVDALGVDNQGESCLAWHAQSKRALSPVIVWQDNRTHAVIEQLKRDGHEARVLEISGLPLDSYFSASKLAWILQNVSEAKVLLAQGMLRMGTTDAFFLDRLANRFVTDITTASRTSLMDLESGQWDQQLCDMFGVPLECLPEIVPTSGYLGSIVSQGRHIPVRASVVDQQASLYGHGCRELGDAKITFGTGAFALVLTGNQALRSPEQGLLPTVAWQMESSVPMYALDGGVYCAGSAIDWGRKLGLFKEYAEINQFDRASAIERDLVFVPALSGLACPHWDRTAAGIWLGLSLETDALDLMQAVLEGVALRAAEVIRAMSEFVAIGDQISIDGGVSVNPYFCQFLANVLGRQVLVKPMAELTAIGTAQLAGAESIDLGLNDAPVLRYQPTIDMSHHSERFSEAVARSKNWRQ